MASCRETLLSSSILDHLPSLSPAYIRFSSASSPYPISSFLPLGSRFSTPTAHVAGFRPAHHLCSYLSIERGGRRKHVCRAGEYKFPDPIPEFADAETEKFRTHLATKLSKKEAFGDSLDDVVTICTEILSTFLHSEYGGPGTLLVEPFIDMADTINERGLPGGPQAARVAVKWAQDHVDKDWKEWTGVAVSSK
ncbi:unnamed protein product [Linum tenue]|uniref:Uncharacterized protein n=1 Tax=Linum tenue TaxID=586396 RepID=A0AAV0HMF6_9ROSI|nr:unnamed protein product [Linum tenue]